jgi:hypothetical protein
VCVCEHVHAHARLCVPVSFANIFVCARACTCLSICNPGRRKQR